MDRPPATAVPVQLFGRRFDARFPRPKKRKKKPKKKKKKPATGDKTMARASGCALLPVYLPRTFTAYTAHILARDPVERVRLRDLSARPALTQPYELVRTRDSTLPNQWYHLFSVMARG